MQLNKRKFGSFGENIAVQYLQDHGYKIAEINYRVGRIGEVDIIAYHNEFICFIEVKTRRSIAYGTPAEAVNVQKRNKITKIAHMYLKQRRLSDRCIRFDIAEVFLNKDNSVKEINIIQNAF